MCRVCTASPLRARVMDAFRWLARTLASRSREALKAKDVPPGAPKQLRVGRGGEVPVFPPLAALLLSGASVAAWGLTGLRLRFIPSALPVAAQLALSAAVPVASGRTKTACDAALIQAGTEANFAAVSRVARTGPYAVCRNAMYVALAAMPLALALATDSAWLLFAAMGTLAYTDLIVVPVEEAFLREQLGEDYKRYCTEVPRWPWGG